MEATAGSAAPNAVVGSRLGFVGSALPQSSWGCGCGTDRASIPRAARVALSAKKGAASATGPAVPRSPRPSPARQGNGRHYRGGRATGNERWERVGGCPPRNVADNDTTHRAPALRHLDAFPSLVLNADYRPLSFLPLSLWAWQDVMKAVTSDRVAVVAEYENVAVRTPGEVFRLPSVVSLKEFRPVYNRPVPFSRFNVFLRDDFTCQYCHERGTPKTLTFDHIVPSCKGGRRNWSNIVTACPTCNHKKGRKLLSELGSNTLQKKPTEPSTFLLATKARKYPPRRVHDSWIDYLYWDAPMLLENRLGSEDNSDGFITPDTILQEL